MKSKLYTISILAIFVIFGIYFYTFYKEFTYSNEFLSNTTTSSQPTEGKDTSESDMKFELELRLESKEEVNKLDGRYIVEKYREYAIYKDDKGEVIKAVPTGNFNYLHYKK